MKIHDVSFWKGKSVLVTGHTGFKGAWLSLLLHEFGAKVIGISLKPATNPNLYTLLGLEDSICSHIQDIRDSTELSNIVSEADPEIIFHLAAQPLVRQSYEEPVNTFSTNIMGTLNLLECVRDLKNLASLVCITTDKVYRNNELRIPYVESDSLGGYDPYSSSKAASEILIDSYRYSFFSNLDFGIASARAGNVIGGGDWSRDRLIPDLMKAWQSNQTVRIRKPGFIRPWQHVLEPIFGYLTLAQKLYEDPKVSDSYNFGPELDERKTVKEIVELALKSFGRGEVVYGEDLNDYHESDWLELNIDKAKKNLGFTPRWSIEKSVTETVRWYSDLKNGYKASDLCKRNLEDYLNE